MRPVIEAGEVHPKVSCAAVPLRLPARRTATVWLMVPGDAGVPAPLVVATRRTAARIAAGKVNLALSARPHFLIPASTRAAA